MPDEASQHTTYASEEGSTLRANAAGGGPPPPPPPPPRTSPSCVSAVRYFCLFLSSDCPSSVRRPPGAGAMGPQELFIFVSFFFIKKNEIQYRVRPGTL
jgi:hypothetical protein